MTSLWKARLKAPQIDVSIKGGEKMLFPRAPGGHQIRKFSISIHSFSANDVPRPVLALGIERLAKQTPFHCLQLPSAKEDRCLSSKHANERPPNK